MHTHPVALWPTWGFLADDTGNLVRFTGHPALAARYSYPQSSGRVKQEVRLLLNLLSMRACREMIQHARGGDADEA